MTDRAKARAAHLAALLEEDGTLTPAEPLPEGLLTQGKDLEATYLEALIAETVGEGLQAVRGESGLETPEVLARRGLSKGRLSQIERPDLNPQLSTITQQADALEYAVTIVFTPQDKGRRAVRGTGGRVMNPLQARLPAVDLTVETFSPALLSIGRNYD